MKSPNRFQRVLGYALSVLIVMAAVYYGTAFYYKRKIEQTKSIYLETLRQVGKGVKAKSHDLQQVDSVTTYWNPDDLPLSFRQESYFKWLAQGIDYRFEVPGQIGLKDMMQIVGHLNVRHNDRDGRTFYFRRFRQESDAYGTLPEVTSAVRGGRGVAVGKWLVKRLDVARKSIDIPRPFEFYRYAIINTGKQTAMAPVLYNDVLWTSTQRIVASSGLGGIKNETDRALALWRFMAENRYHYYPVTNGDEEVDVVKYLSVYGYGWCGESALVMARLADEIGLKSRVWRLEGHVVPEIFADGKWIMLDPDRLVYFHEPGNEKAIYGIEELSHSKEAFSHEVYVAAANVRGRLKRYKDEYIQFFMSTDDNTLNELNGSAQSSASPYGRIYEVGATADYTIENSLRPGEKVVFTNYNWGKYFLGMFPFRVPKYFNGYYQYTAPLPGNSASTEHCAVAHTRLGTEITNRSSKRTACITIDNRYPFPVVGGEINGSIRKQVGQVNVVLKDDDNDLTATYEASQFLGSNDDLRIVTDPFFSVVSHYPTYHYSVAFEFEPGASVVLDEPLTVISDFQFAEMALLKLNQGNNRFKVSANTESPTDFEFKLSLQ